MDFIEADSKKDNSDREKLLFSDLSVMPNKFGSQRFIALAFLRVYCFSFFEGLLLRICC